MGDDRQRTTDPARLERLLKERTADLQRVKAEYDNYRKRVRRDRQAVREIAVANVLRTLLPVLDAVDRTCAHEPMTPGLKDIRDTLHTQLGALGLQPVGEQDEPFDPARHDAVTQHISPDAGRLVCTRILRRGYRLGDQLLRPAHVEVTGPPPAQDSPPGASDDGRPQTADDGRSPAPVEEPTGLVGGGGDRRMPP